MAWFLPREPMKFTFPGPVSLIHKAPCCVLTGFGESVGLGGSLDEEGECAPQAQEGRGEGRETAS